MAAQCLQSETHPSVWLLTKAPKACFRHFTRQPLDAISLGSVDVPGPLPQLSSCRFQFRPISPGGLRDHTGAGDPTGSSVPPSTWPTVPARSVTTAHLRQDQARAPHALTRLLKSRMQTAPFNTPMPTRGKLSITYCARN